MVRGARSGTRPGGPAGFLTRPTRSAAARGRVPEPPGGVNADPGREVSNPDRGDRSPGRTFFLRRFFRTDDAAELLACTDTPTHNHSRKMLPDSRRRGGSAWSSGPGADGTGPRSSGNS